MYPARSGTSSGSRNCSPVASRSRKGGASRRPSCSLTVTPYSGRWRRRPVPGQAVLSSRAETEPVTMNRPGRASASTARFTAPSTAGTACHSSSSTGSSNCRSATSGSASNAVASCGLSSRTTEAACCSAVVVLPAARGPVMSTAGSSDGSSPRSESSASFPRLLVPISRRKEYYSPAHVGTISRTRAADDAAASPHRPTPPASCSPASMPGTPSVSARRNAAAPSTASPALRGWRPPRWSTRPPCWAATSASMPGLSPRPTPR